jgi:hypothetical protein
MVLPSIMGKLFKSRTNTVVVQTRATVRLLRVLSIRYEPAQPEHCTKPGLKAVYKAEAWEMRSIVDWRPWVLIPARLGIWQISFGMFSHVTRHVVAQVLLQLNSQPPIHHECMAGDK